MRLSLEDASIFPDTGTRTHLRSQPLLNSIEELIDKYMRSRH